MFDFFRYVIRFRKAHPIVRRFHGFCSNGVPEIQVFERPEETKVLRVYYAGRNQSGTEDEIICLAINVYWEEQAFNLPELSLSLKWKAVLDTGKTILPDTIPQRSMKTEPISDLHINMAPRSVCVFIADNAK
jgi:glycogen operon protein